MVTATEPQDADETITVVDPVETATETAEPETPTEAPVEGAPEGTPEPVPSEGAPVGTEDQVAAPTDTVAQEPPPPAVPQVDQKSIDELRRYQEADVEREWKEKLGRTARAYEQRLTDAGYLPEQSREQARQYIQQEQKFRKQEQETSNMVGYVQGKYEATVQILEKHGLVSKQMLSDFRALQAANTPAEMEREAQRMKRERALVAENARLKQGRVAPQTFDDNRGAAEVTSNQDRLLEAYIAGDRSDAALQAARRLALGN